MRAQVQWKSWRFGEILPEEGIGFVIVLWVQWVYSWKKGKTGTPPYDERVSGVY